MPDPQRDIAPIIEPAAPPMPQAAPDYSLALAIAAGGLLLAAWLYWRWRRRAPLRALRGISQISDPIAGSHVLAVLMREYGNEAPQAWQEELDQLRFGPPQENAGAALARLCKDAESMLRRR